MAQPTGPISSSASLVASLWYIRLEIEVAAQEEDYVDCDPDVSALVGDSICDLASNTAGCAYDGGDCCECTCVDSDTHTCGSGTGYFCLDPDAPVICLGRPATTATTAAPTTAPPTIRSTAESLLSTTSACAGYLPHVQDGYCDDVNNNAACGYDGGDCCECTCLEGLAHECGGEDGRFDCRDPSAADFCAHSDLAACVVLSYSYDLQNAVCDTYLNNAACLYDGGDCCECTCREFEGSQSCGEAGFDCQDPDAFALCGQLSASPTIAPSSSPLVTDSPTPAPTLVLVDCAGLLESIADGFCDALNNNEGCGWDGGDCCECTCEDSVAFACGSDGFDCQDPGAVNCTDATSQGSGSSTTTEATGTGYDDGLCLRTSAVGDGHCDLDFNTEECSYDAGDCCECTCVSGDFECGTNGYVCRDPNSESFCTSASSLGGRGGSSIGTGTSLSSGTLIGMLVGSFLTYCLFTGLIVVALVLVAKRCRRAHARTVPTCASPRGKDEEMPPVLPTQSPRHGASGDTSGRQSSVDNEGGAGEAKLPSGEGIFFFTSTSGAPPISRK